jgi:catechol 2,3-dioxygenase-like lactoylglutathione lyase family enzyme
MIILYVLDQQKSRDFYTAVLDLPPILDVPGMTEFKLSEGLLLGLMPEKGIAKIICPAMPEPSEGSGIPRCELYLFVADPGSALNTAVKNGAKFISHEKTRDWGDTAAYCADPDGHIIAFTKKKLLPKIQIPVDLVGLLHYFTNDRIEVFGDISNLSQQFDIYRVRHIFPVE